MDICQPFYFTPFAMVYSVTVIKLLEKNEEFSCRVCECCMELHGCSAREATQLWLATLESTTKSLWFLKLEADACVTTFFKLIRV